MAVWSIIETADVAVPARWDAEYFTPENLRLAAILAKRKPVKIESFADVTDGIHASPEWVDEGVAYLSAKCVREHFVNIQSAGQISNAQDAANPRTRARSGDVVITSVGTIGNAAVVEDWMLPANMDRHLGIIRIRDPKKVDPYYLATFLNCKFGRFQSLRESTGNVQLNLFIEKIRGIRVPVTEQLQKVGRLVRKACADLRETDSLYPEAEADLLERLGWEKIRRQKKELSYVRNFAELSTAMRADAEFFQPQYARMRTQLSKRGSRTLRDLVTHFDKGTQPDQYRDDGEVIVVKSKQVTGRGISLERCERTTASVWNDVSARLHAGDLVMNSTGRGTLGRVAVMPAHSGKAVAAVDLVIAHLRHEIIHPEYAALFLNSPAGLAQSDQFQTGSSGQLHLYPQHFAQFLIYLPLQKNGTVDLAWQAGLVAKVEAAFAAKAASRARLEEAKRLVEQAINN